MPIITSIRPQRNKKRVNIYLDGKFGFGLDLENFVKLNLKVGDKLSEKDIKQIVKKAKFQKTLDKLLRFATLRPRSEKEIKNWFKKHKVHKSLHKELFNRLRRIDLIDDKEFAKWWIGQRLQFKYKSKRELQYELQIKGIDKEIINQLINESVSQEKEVEMAKKLLDKKKYMWRKYDGFERTRKMRAYLGRKGFEWDVVKQVLSALKIDDKVNRQ